VNSTTLVSLAMLKVNSDVRHSDYLEYIVPFVADAIGTLNQAEFTADDIKPLLRTEFGLAIPRSAVDVVLQRLASRRKILRANKRYSKVPGQEVGGSLVVARTEALRRENVVINSLTSFAAAKTVTWTTEKASEAFLQYLTSFSIDCLRTYAQGTALPEIKEGSRSIELYLVNAFVRHAHESSVELFDNVMVLVKGHMLANALICPDLGSTGQKFSQVTFFLDTPLVLDAVGLHGVDAEAACLELLDLLKHLRGTVAVFEHTFLEVDGVIRSAESRYSDSESRGRVILEAKRAGRTASDLTLSRARLESTLLERGIGKTPRPQHDAPFQVDEETLEKELREGIGYLYDGAARHDVESIRSVYALRRGRAPARLENTEAVMVTTNPVFARIAYKFGQAHESSREVSTVITDFSLANIAWLKAPLGAPDLPRLEVLANCYAAMEPPAAVWRRYLEEIDRLRKDGRIGPEDHEILRFSLQARDELMEVMLRDGEQVSSLTVQEVIGNVKADLVREKDAAIHLQQQTLEERDAAAATVIVERDSLQAQRQRRLKRAYWLADRVAKWAAWLLFGLTAFVVVAATFAWPVDKLLPFLHLPSAVTKIMSSLGSAMLLILGVCGTIWGSSVKGFAGAVRNRIRSVVYGATLFIMMEDRDSDISGAEPAPVESVSRVDKFMRRG
jgi:hypothetical protein